MIRDARRGERWSMKGAEKLNLADAVWINKKIGSGKSRSIWNPNHKSCERFHRDEATMTPRGDQFPGGKIHHQDRRDRSPSCISKVFTSVYQDVYKSFQPGARYLPQPKRKTREPGSWFSLLAPTTLCQALSLSLTYSRKQKFRVGAWCKRNGSMLRTLRIGLTHSPESRSWSCP